MLTPVEKLDGLWVKRDDMANWSALDYPSGSKVRQYAKMALPGIPMIVGCSSYSAMQIYVAAAAKQAKVAGFVFVSIRKELTSATKYAQAMGAVINEIKPGYMSVVRKRAKDHALSLGKTVRWDVALAMKDIIEQTQNLPLEEINRIIVPTGSGLTAAAILAASASWPMAGHKKPRILAVAVSGMADISKIIAGAAKVARLPGGRLFSREMAAIGVVNCKTKYGQHKVAQLPDSTPLDPYYSAKALEYAQPNDLLWLPGLRPVCSMPEDCQIAFKGWRGFK